MKGIPRRFSPTDAEINSKPSRRACSTAARVLETPYFRRAPDECWLTG